MDTEQQDGPWIREVKHGLEEAWEPRKQSCEWGMESHKHARTK